MWVCSVTKTDSKPRSSAIRASSAGSIDSSVGKYATPKSTARILSGPACSLGPVDDLGQPSSYLALQEGIGVYSSDGERIGKVEHVLAVPEDDIFDGIVLDTSVLPGGHRFVDAPQVQEI